MLSRDDEAALLCSRATAAFVTQGRVARCPPQGSHRGQANKATVRAHACDPPSTASWRATHPDADPLKLAAFDVALEALVGLQPLKDYCSPAA